MANTYWTVNSTNFAPLTSNAVPSGGTATGLYTSSSPTILTNGTWTWSPDPGEKYIWNMGVASAEIVRVGRDHGAEGDHMVMNLRTLERALIECRTMIPSDVDTIHFVVEGKSYEVVILNELPDKMVLVVSRAKTMFRRKPNIKVAITPAQPMTANKATRWMKLYKELTSNATITFNSEPSP